MTQDTPNQCPVCKSKAEIQLLGWGGGAGLFDVICRRCGRFQMPVLLAAILGPLLKSDVDSAALSHAIRKLQINIKEGMLPPYLDGNLVERLRRSPLPSPIEQTDNLVLLLGDNLPSLGSELERDPLTIQAEIGAINLSGVQLAIQHLHEKHIISVPSTGLHPNQMATLALTVQGWDYYGQLKRESASSRKAFMAMPYGKKELDDLVDNHFRSAVKCTGFELYRLDDEPKAGLIDDRLRVEIRTSRFLIADLTDGNNGAYWEAGFAEGLGKPVIYTCEKKRFDETKTHFDTNHHTTVLWDTGDLERTVRDLKNAIRATLPGEAKLTDD